MEEGKDRGEKNNEQKGREEKRMVQWIGSMDAGLMQAMECKQETREEWRRRIMSRAVLTRGGRDGRIYHKIVHIRTRQGEDDEGRMSLCVCAEMYVNKVA